MVRLVCAILFLVATLSPASSSDYRVFKSRAEAEAYVDAHRSDVMVDGYIPALTLCSDATDDCVLGQAIMLAETKRAYEGNYQGQRNLAFCLWNGCDDSTVKNKVLSCAWRMVILASGSVAIDRGDIMSMEQCLTDDFSLIEKATMKSQAAALFRTVYDREIPTEWR